jgi:YesN/AraC family two-component response regulator
MANILIVDDSVIMRRNLKSMLVQSGHTIVGEASDGVEAYREYGRLLPDLVTMDITMPVMNGIDAVQKIIASYPDAKIIMISALDQRNMVFEAIQNGAKHYILKPVTVVKILETINEVLKLKSTEPSVSPEESAIDMDVPLAIENKNGIFLIRIGAYIESDKLNELQTAVQGFLFVKPLRVVFDFGGIGVLKEDVLLRLLGLMRQLHEANGSIKALSNNHTFIETLKEHNPDSFFRIHTEWSQVIF